MVRIDASRICDWSSFHDVFAEVLGFPDYYGRNLDAWIDCLSYADDPHAGMLKRAVPKGETLTLQLDNVDDLATSHPEQYQALLECAAFVNWRRIEAGSSPVLFLSFNRG